MARKFSFYFLFIGICITTVWYVLNTGNKPENKPFSSRADIQTEKTIANVPAATKENNWFINSFHELTKSVRHPLSILILQILVIMVFARIMGLLCLFINQPAVVGEIFAGIILGPSLFGIFFPGLSTFLFPPASLNNLQFLSQLGLLLFMFIIGMELDVKKIKSRASDALIVSHTAIAFSYLLGVLVSLYLYHEFAAGDIPFFSFALFMGIAMSITAFPVLARIIQEKGHSKTPLGVFVLTCAAVDDVTAWCILAVVIAIIKAGTILNSLFTIALVLVYVFFMLRVVHSLLQKIGKVYISKENMNRTVVALVFLILLLSSYTTEVLGIHALFGAFLAGVVMPDDFEFKSIISEKIEDISLVMLLPLFFVFTGLRTQIGLINSPRHLLICLFIIVVAIFGKLGGATLAARFVGQSWKNSVSIGVLMNTRGLMELVVLNIGYDLGVLRPEIFTMMVIMAVVTTVISGPLLGVVNKIFGEDNKSISPLNDGKKILISFGNPKMGSVLLRLANYLTSNHNGISGITALHITPRSEISIQDAQVYEIESFRPIQQAARELGIRIDTLYRPAGKIEKEIALESRKDNYKIILAGSARSVFNNSITGGKIKYILDESVCNVGILVNNNFREVNNLLVILHQKSDLNLVKYVNDFIENSVAKVLIFDPGRLAEESRELINMLQKNQAGTNIINDFLINKVNLAPFDLIIVSIDYWQKASEFGGQILHSNSSVLIIKTVQKKQI
ncbi:MAG: cation:proton antiporter [Ignavibacteria bacterium]